MALPLVIEDPPAIAVLMRLPLVLVLVAPVMVEPGIVVPVIMPIVIVALASASTIVVAAPIVLPPVTMRPSFASPMPSLSGPTLIAPSQLAPPLLLVASAHAPLLFTPATLRLVTPAELLTSEHARVGLARRKTRFVVKRWGAPPKSLGRCGSARAQSIFLPSITLGCKNLKHTTQGHSKHG